MRRWMQFSSITLLLHASRSTHSFRKTRDVRMVPSISPEEEKEIRQEETDKINIENTDISNLENNNDSIIEISEAEMKALPKLFRKSFKKESCMTTEERQRLTQMIFNTHYAQEGLGINDKAMWYQSALEIKWLEEWAMSNSNSNNELKEENNNNNNNEIRLAVKKAVLQRVELHKPLAYIIGYQPFYGCNIQCFPPLLCPRPETEMWTHWFVINHLSQAMKTKCNTKENFNEINNNNNNLRVLDMCCGTGCVGIAIAKHVSSSEIVAIDILDEAIKVSENNAKINGIDLKRYHAIKSDMFETFLESNEESNKSSNINSKENYIENKLNSQKRKVTKSYEGSFDVIVSNPPYVLPEQYKDLSPGIKLWESKIALVGDPIREEKQYLYFQELCEIGATMLKPKINRNPFLMNSPNFIIEVGLQAEQVASLMERSGLWEKVEIHLDYAQQMRWISASSLH